MKTHKGSNGLSSRSTDTTSGWSGWGVPVMAPGLWSLKCSLMSRKWAWNELCYSFLWALLPVVSSSLVVPVLVVLNPGHHLALRRSIWIPPPHLPLLQLQLPVTLSFSGASWGGCGTVPLKPLKQHNTVDFMQVKSNDIAKRHVGKSLLSKI